MKWYLHRIGCLLLIFIFISICHGESGVLKSGRLSAEEYNFIMAISPNYCLLGDPEYKPKLDLIKKYKGNALRVFAYAGWDDNFKYFPWNGDNYKDLKSDYFTRTKKFVDEANKRGIIVIMSMFQNNSGGGFEDCAKVDRSLLHPYIQRMVKELKGKDVIFESINEDVDPDFNRFVVDEVKAVNPNAKCCTYKNYKMTDYSNYHLLRREYIGGGRIHSNDVGGYDKFYTDDDYFNVTKQAKEQGGHVEWLVYWPRKKGAKNNIMGTVKNIEENYATMLERIKTLKATSRDPKVFRSKGGES